MLVALTGASGFIGSYTARAMHAAGHRVRALVRTFDERVAGGHHAVPIGDQAQRRAAARRFAAQAPDRRERLILALERPE